MNTQDTMDHSHAFAADGRRGWINSLGGAIELMTAFSREVRADDCNMDADGICSCSSVASPIAGDKASFML